MKPFNILKGNSQIFLAVHQLVDFLMVGFAFMAAMQIKESWLPAGSSGLSVEYNYQLLMLLLMMVCHICFRIFDFYERFRLVSFTTVLLRIVKGVLAGAGCTLLFLYMFHMSGVSRLLVGIFTVLLIVLLIGFKGTVYWLLKYGRERDHNTRHILVVGARSRSQDFIRQIMRNPSSGFRVSGCLETDEYKDAIGAKLIGRVRIIGLIEDFQQILTEKEIDEVVFKIPLKLLPNVHEMISFAEEIGVTVRILPDFQLHQIKYLPTTASLRIEQFLGVSTLQLSSVPDNQQELYIKSIVDYGASALAVLLLSPLLLLLALVIKLDSRGPAIYAQVRCGLNGRKFNVYKFRTMVVNADELRAKLESQNEMDGPVFKMERDPRITRVGAFLRKTSLDELPQLINVLKGEMSLVGPRPPIPAEVEQYKVWQRRRLSMKPGLTCIWQVSGRNNINFEQWMNMDLEYIDNWSLWLDFKLLLKTVREVAVGGGR